MTINDPVYGLIDIAEPLIVELIGSAPMQRLKHISQDGAVHFIQPVFTTSRFDHSVGTWYLASRLGRPLEEQVACLLHDVPHTAFSHVVDFVMDDADQEYHDRFLKAVVMGSDIPDICARHGLDIHTVLQKEHYPLLDNKLPQLSFDRWDYTLRDAYTIGVLSRETAMLIVESVKVDAGSSQFYFEDFRIATQLSIASLMVSHLSYTCATPVGSYFVLADALKTALQEHVITEEDLFTTDDEVMKKLQQSANKRIAADLARLQPGKLFTQAPRDEAEFYGPTKARYIDPLVLIDGEFVPVSEYVINLKPYIETYKQRAGYTGVKPLYPVA